MPVVRSGILVGFLQALEMSFQGGAIFAARGEFGLQPFYKKFKANNLIAKLVNLGRL